MLISFLGGIDAVSRIEVTSLILQTNIDVL
jgi:hypothetical protein